MQRFTELKQRVALAWRIIRNRDAGLVRHGLREHEALGHTDPMDQLMQQNVIDLLRVLSSQGHSGFSIRICLARFDAVARYKPMTPLTGAEDEWCEVGDGVHQNRRCSHVFKQPDRFCGRPYDLQAVVFEEPNGSRFTGFHSMRPVTFPYSPRSVVVKLPEDASDDLREQLAAEAWAKA